MSGTQKHHQKEKVKIYGRYRENHYELTAMYWHIGDRINRDVLNNERAEYGQQIVSHVATQLQQEYETKSFELPSKEVLLRQLQKSLAAAKELTTER